MAPQATTVFIGKPRPVRWSGLFYNLVCSSTNYLVEAYFSYRNEQWRKRGDKGSG